MSDEKEETFQEFVAGCALRSAYMSEEMRAGAYGKKPLEVLAEFTKLKLSNWHVEQLEKATKRLIKVENWNKDKAEAAAEVAYQEAKESYESILAQQTKTRQHSENMLLRVKDWIPPTSNHEGLKQLMIKELTDTINSSNRFALSLPQRLSGSEYVKKEVASAQKHIEYHKKEYTKEVKYSEERTNWVCALRDSL